MKKLTCKQVWEDPRDTIDIDPSYEHDLYYAKLAIEFYGTAVRDNSLTELIELGLEIERNEYE